MILYEVKLEVFIIYLHNILLFRRGVTDVVFLVYVKRYMAPAVYAICRAVEILMGDITQCKVDVRRQLTVHP